jgi:hypothetical protein
VVSRNLFQIGESITAHYLTVKEGSRKFKGCIRGINESHTKFPTYWIEYEDGDMWMDCPEGAIFEADERPRVRKGPIDGDEESFRDDDDVRDDSDESFAIDRDRVDKDKDGKPNPLANSAATVLSNHMYKVNERVLALFNNQGSQKYGAFILACNPDGTYDVLYDDGDNDKHCPESSLFEESTGLPRVLSLHVKKDLASIDSHALQESSKSPTSKAFSMSSNVSRDKKRLAGLNLAREAVIQQLVVSYPTFPTKVLEYIMHLSRKRRQLFASLEHSAASTGKVSKSLEKPSPAVKTGLLRSRFEAWIEILCPAAMIDESFGAEPRQYSIALVHVLSLLILVLKCCLTKGVNGNLQTLGVESDNVATSTASSPQADKTRTRSQHGAPRGAPKVKSSFELLCAQFDSSSWIDALCELYHATPNEESLLRATKRLMIMFFKNDQARYRACEMYLYDHQMSRIRSLLVRATEQWDLAPGCSTSLNNPARPTSLHLTGQSIHDAGLPLRETSGNQLLPLLIAAPILCTVLDKLHSLLSSISARVNKHPIYWREFLNERSKDFVFLLYISVQHQFSSASGIILTLLIAAIDREAVPAAVPANKRVVPKFGANSDKADTTQSASEARKVLDAMQGNVDRVRNVTHLPKTVFKPPVMAAILTLLPAFIQNFLLKSPEGIVRQNAQLVIKHIFSRCQPADREKLLQLICNWVDFIPHFGKNSQEMFELLTYFLNQGCVHNESHSSCVFTLVGKHLFSLLNRQLGILRSHPLRRFYAMLRAAAEKFSAGSSDVEKEKLGLLTNPSSLCLLLEPCFVCHLPESETKLHKLKDICNELKYSSNSAAFKLNSAYRIQNFSIQMSEINSLRMVKTIRILINASPQPPATELPSLLERKDAWIVTKTINLQPHQKDAVANFSIPLQASYVMVQIIDLYESGSLERLNCPRCSAVVTSPHGLCEKCQENAHQCRVCRNINYENLTGFLCNECGHCRYCRIHFFMSGASLPIDSVANENDSKAALSRLAFLSEQASLLKASALGHLRRAESVIASVLPISSSVCSLDVFLATDPILKNCKSVSKEIGLLGFTMCLIRQELNLYLERPGVIDVFRGQVSGATCYSCGHRALRLVVAGLCAVPSACFISAIESQEVSRAELLLDLLSLLVDSPAVLTLSESQTETCQRLVCTLLREDIRSLRTWQIFQETVEMRMKTALLYPEQTTDTCFEVYVAILTKSFAEMNTSSSYPNVSFLYIGQLRLAVKLLLFSAASCDRPDVITRVTLPCFELIAGRNKSAMLPFTASSGPQVKSPHAAPARGVIPRGSRPALRARPRALTSGLGRGSPLTLASQNPAAIQSRSPSSTLGGRTTPASRSLSMCFLTDRSPVNAGAPPGLPERSPSLRVTSSDDDLHVPNLALNNCMRLPFAPEPPSEKVFVSLLQLPSGRVVRPLVFEEAFSRIPPLSTAQALGPSVRRIFYKWRNRTVGCRNGFSFNKTWFYLSTAQALCDLLTCPASSAVREHAQSVFCSLCYLSLSEKDLKSESGREVKSESGREVKSESSREVNSDSSRNLKNEEPNHSTGRSGHDQICSPRMLSVAMLLLTKLKLMSDQRNNVFDCFFELFRLLLQFQHVKCFLVTKGLLNLLMDRIHIEIKKLLQAERACLSPPDEPHCLHGCVVLLESLCQDAHILRKFKRDANRAQEIWETFLELRGVIVYRSALSDACAAILLSLGKTLLSDSQDQQASVVAYVNALERADLDKRTSVFLLEQLCQVIHPVLPEKSCFLLLKKAASQEDFLRGSINGPRASSEFDGPLMVHVKNKICKDLGMVDADNTLLELLVDNKIINFNLPIVKVFERVWQPALTARPSVLNSSLSLGDLPLGQMVVDPAGNEVFSIDLADVPMIVTYRLTGLDGEATENKVDSLPDPVAEVIDPERQYAITAVLAQTSGLRTLVARLSQLTEGPLVHEIDLRVCELLLQVLGYCSQLHTNRIQLISLSASQIALAARSSSSAAAVPQALEAGSSAPVCILQLTWLIIHMLRQGERPSLSPYLSTSTI